MTLRTASNLTYEIGPMLEDHLDGAADVLAEAGRPWRHMADREIARRFLEVSMRRGVDYNLVALCDDRVVGYTCALRPRGRVAGCGPLALHPDHATTGLTSQLLMRSIAAAIERNVGLLRLPIALHKSIFNIIYRGMKLEFTGETYIRFERHPGEPVPEPSEHRAVPVDAAGLDRIAAFERELYTDADRIGDYRDALEALDGRAWLLERENTCSATVLGVPGLGLGPLIAADAIAAADALRVATAFDDERNKTSVVHINAADRELVEEALRLGYVCREPVLVFERSFDGTRSKPAPGIRCIGFLGAP
jgi:GNAT superfamily N-acetyltransferase